MKALQYFAAMTVLVASTSALAVNKKATPKQAPQATAKKIDFAKDVDGLGGNEDLMTMADSLNPEAKSRIVQDRIVDRHNRLEIGITYGGSMGGTTYLQTQNLGGSLDYHITPRWSIGARYYDYRNQLTPEGERLFDEARKSGTSSTYVDIDTPFNSKMATVSWFPIYGKTNFFDMAVTQFDLYLLIGGGQIELASGYTPITTGGLGIGVWMTQHLTARAEIRYQSYEDQIRTGSRLIGSAAATVGLGWIL
jgi:outer membrane beta-barrel protein